MTESITQVVMRLGKAGRKQEAIDLVRQYVQQHPNDLEGWWCAANIVPNPRMKMQAVQKVLQLNPNHEKARQMLAKLQSVSVAAEHPVPLRSAQNPFEYEASLPKTSPFTAPIEEADQPPRSSAVRATPGGAKLPTTGPLDLTSGKKKPEVSISDETAWMLTGIVLVIAVILIGGVVYWYTQIRDTNKELEFTESAILGQMTIKHPDDWIVRKYDDSSRLVVINKATATENLDPWRVLVDNGQVPEWAFVSFIESIEYSSEQENTYAYVLQQLPQDPLYLIDIMVGGWQSAYDEGIFEDTLARLSTNREALEVDGSQSVFSSIDLNVKTLDGFDISDLNIAFYFATINKNNKHYMFTMMVFEDKDEVDVDRNWEAEAKRVAQTITITE